MRRKALLNSSETSAAPPASLHDGFLDGTCHFICKMHFHFFFYFLQACHTRTVNLQKTKEISRHKTSLWHFFLVCFMQQLHAHKKSVISETSFEEEETALEMLGFIFCWLIESAWAEVKNMLIATWWLMVQWWVNAREAVQKKRKQRVTLPHILESCLMFGYGFHMVWFK